MTPNDAQMDVLLRRYARHANRDAATDHLDADEMNAFAESKLPAAARARYVSHLADCDQCRRDVAQLAISAGAVTHLEEKTTEKIEGTTVWQTLAALFALPVLRYAAFGAVVLIVAGVALLVLRRPQDSALVAVNEPTSQQPASAVQSPEGFTQPTAGNESKQTNTERLASGSPPVLSSKQIPDRDQSKAAENTSEPAKPEKDASTTSTLAEKKAPDSTVTAASPSYAPPPPPGEEKRAQAMSREQQTVGGFGSVSGPRKTEQQLDKLSTQKEQAGNFAKDVPADANTRTGVNQSASNVRRSADEKAKGPQRDAGNIAVNRNANEAGRAGEARPEAPKALSATANRVRSEEAPQTRSVGGRKFRRQGNAWVDQKFKSSMTLKNVARGSDEFNALNSGLRSITQQIGGEVIVVWKGKAYLIH